MLFGFLRIAFVLFLTFSGTFLALLVRYQRTKLFRHQNDLSTLSLWLRSGNLHQNLKLLTVEGQELASVVHRQLQSHKKALTRLQKESLTDDLTGLLNRRGMKGRLTGEYNRIVRYEAESYALLLFDVDNFKLLNDRFGHAAGDLVLQRLAQVVKGSLRCSDVCCRWGGDEFLLLLPGAKCDDAHRVAEKLSLAVSALRFPAIAQELAVTLTIGLVVDDGSLSVDEAIGEADLSLYQGKRMGRNCIAPLRQHPHPRLTSAGQAL